MTAAPYTPSELTTPTRIGAVVRVDVKGLILGPCDRPGQRVSAGHPVDDWWREPHLWCTGSEHLGPDVVAVCACPCHTTRPHLRCPKTYGHDRPCTCGNVAVHAEQARLDAEITAAPYTSEGPS